jgi:hypothetical protein
MSAEERKQAREPLIEYAKFSTTNRVLSLPVEGMSPDNMGSNGDTALHLATKCGHTEMIEGHHLAQRENQSYKRTRR